MPPYMSDIMQNVRGVSKEKGSSSAYQMVQVRLELKKMSGISVALYSFQSDFP